MNILGIEIGGTKLQLVRGDENGAITERHRVGIDAASGASDIQARIQEAVRKRFAGNRFDAVGAGFGGPVDCRNGVIARSHQVVGWSGFPLRQWLEDLVGASARVDNDANVAALAEARIGAGQRCNPLFYVTLGSGVGGGLVLNGQIYHGAPPGEAEIGHLRLLPDGSILESRCSGWAIDHRIRQLKTSDPTSFLAGAMSATTGGEARLLADALRAGDSHAEQIMRELCAELAWGLSHVTHLMHPEVIVLGGGLSLIGEPLRAGTEDAIRKLLMEVFLPGPMIRLAALKEDAVPAGALLLAGAAAGS